jgi:Lrp/AsnC family transcriptional regulator for asnA, asnC and gidA
MRERNLDATDWRILSILMKEHPIANVAIASRLGVSESTIRRRIEALTKAGVLEFVPLMSPEEVGLRTQAIIGLDVELTKLESIEEALATSPKIKYLAYVMGRYDLIMTAYFSSEDELLEFLTHQLPEIDGIRNAETLKVLKVTKRSWHFLPDGVLMEESAEGAS